MLDALPEWYILLIFYLPALSFTQCRHHFLANDKTEMLSQLSITFPSHHDDPAYYDVSILYQAP